MERKKFANQFKQVRDQMGLSLKEMASLMKISIEAAKRIEQGLVCPDTPNFTDRLNWISKREVMEIR